MLRRILATPLPAVGAVPHLGIDDFAFRRGRRYGTILVDLDTHRVLDLLPERTVDQAAAWLGHHPEITILSRDRGQEYAAAAGQAVPHAQQVADRFHLLQNLTACVETVLGRCWAAIRQQAQHQHTPAPAAPDIVSAAPADTDPLPPAAQQARQAARADRYAQVCELRHAGLSQVAIAQELGLSQRTVERWVAKGAPHAAQRRQRARDLDAYASVIIQRWAEGCHNGLQLWRELQTQGYRGAERSVYRFLATLRQRREVASRTESDASNGPAVRQRHPPGPLAQVVVRQALWVVMHDPARLDPPAQHTLQVMLGCSTTVATLYDVVQRFRGILHARQGDHLDAWLMAARTSAIPELESFVTGIERDKAAVTHRVPGGLEHGMEPGCCRRPRESAQGH